MSAETPLIDIRPDHWEIVQRILQEHVPNLEVWAFGSRAKWNAKAFSDLDLAIITDEPLPLDTSAALNEAFSESDLPWKVDVVDWASVGNGFKKVIERDKVVVQKKGEATRGEWKQVSLIDVCLKVTSGGTPSRRNPAYYEAGCWPWVKTQELKDGWIDDTEEHITDAAIAESSAKVLPANTVLLAMYGATVGQLGILRRPMACNQACCAMISDDKKLDFRFLYYKLLSIRSELKGLATGAAQQNLSGALIKSLRVNLPALNEQHAIAHILGTLDDKIELNRKQNETLEAMARTMFKAWFVDFEPVRAKMEGRWKRGQSLPGMPAHLYELFPDRMVESELGEIPEGWRVPALREVCSYISRGISPKYIDVGGVAVVNQKCIRDFSIDFSKMRRHDASKRKIDDRLLKLWDVLVNSTGVGTLGRVAQVHRLPEVTIVDSHVTVLRAGVEINPLYLGLVVGSMQQEIEALAEGSTGQTELSRAKLGELKILLPKNEVLDSFHDFMKSIFDGVSSNQIDSDVLARIRDTLLSELVSGRLRVPVSLLNLRSAL